MHADREDSERSEEPTSEFGVADILALLRRRWRLIAIVAVSIAVIVAAFAVALPSRYEAVATVQIDPRKKTIVQLENVISDLRGDAATVEGEVEVLRSKTLALKVIESLQLRSNPDFHGTGLRNKLLALVGLARPSVQPEAGLADAAAQDPAVHPRTDEVLNTFEQRLKASRVRNTLIIEVRFTAGDPVLAARVVNSLVEVYLKEQLGAKVKATEAAAALLEQKLAGLRRKVSEAEHRVATYKADHNIFDAEGQLLSEKQMARLMEQTVLARNQSAEARARYDHLQQMLRKGQSRSSIADVLQSNTVRMLKDQLVKATRREAELMTKYGSKHPELIKARAEVGDVQAQIASEVDQIVGNLRNQYEVAEERERALTASLSGLKRQQIVAQQSAVQLRELEREAATSRQIFEAFLTRYKQATETQDLQVADARIIEHADVPLTVASPKRKQIAAFGVIAGLALGIGLAFLLEFASPGIGRPEDAENLLGAPHIASVPKLLPGSDGLIDEQHAARLVMASPSGMFTEAIRSARHELDRRRPSNAPRTVLVASSLPNEGKTLIASNLAHHLAMSGTRTLLIDADLRRSQLSQQLGLAGQAGLIDAIARGWPLERVIVRDRVTGLAVLPAGGASAITISPAEALDAPGLGHRLALLKAHFDTIVLDAPPLLPVVDGRILAEHADQILFVASWRRTPKQLARRAIRLLGTNGTKIAGVVMNQVDPDALSGSYRYDRRAGVASVPTRDAA